MPDCVVTCRTCRTDDNLPKIWRWLCEDCATEHADKHRRETHHRVDVQITQTPTLEDIVSSCQAAAMIRLRNRFI